MTSPKNGNLKSEQLSNYILYAKAKFDSLSEGAILFTLAHELAHLANYHLTTISAQKAESYYSELTADWKAGYVLSFDTKIQNIEQLDTILQEIFSLNKNEASDTHPSKSYREIMVKGGFLAGRALEVLIEEGISTLNRNYKKNFAVGSRQFFVGNFLYEKIEFGQRKDFRIWQILEHKKVGWRNNKIKCTGGLVYLFGTSLNKKEVTPSRHFINPQAVNFYAGYLSKSNCSFDSTFIAHDFDDGYFFLSTKRNNVSPQNGFEGEAYYYKTLEVEKELGYFVKGDSFESDYTNWKERQTFYFNLQD